MHQNKTNKAKASLISHLTELRVRLLKILGSVLVFFALSWFFSDELLRFFQSPIKDFLDKTDGALVFISPIELFLAHMKVALFTSILLSSPYSIYQVWAFISPGLFRKEKIFFSLFWILGAFLFFLGIIFAYFITIPLVYKVLIGYGSLETYPMITLSNHLHFVFRFIIIFGLVFEMPLVFLFICKATGLNVKYLSQYRRHAFVCLALLSACITPPDVLSMFVLMIPLLGLYELSIGLCKIFAS